MSAGLAISRAALEYFQEQYDRVQSPRTEARLYDAIRQVAAAEARQ